MLDVGEFFINPYSVRRDRTIAAGPTHWHVCDVINVLRAKRQHSLNVKLAHLPGCMYTSRNHTFTWSTHSV